MNFLSDIASEGVWTNFYTGKEVSGFGAVSSLSGDTNNNCALLLGIWGGWNPWPCSLPGSSQIACACEHPGQMYLQLRGLCPKSNIDQFYVPRNKERSGAVLLIGLDTTIIDYDKETISWTLLENSQNTTAVTDAPLASFVLGSHEWMIENDNVECSKKGKPYTRILKLTGCMEGEFTCSDGQCIKMEERCDQIIHCRDNSDEKQCYLLVFKEKESYNIKVPPFTIDPNDNSVEPVRVGVSISLMNVLEISEFRHTIDLKIGITLKWYENRVFYHNLKSEEALNALTDSEVSKIWVPYVIFQNTDDGEAVKVDALTQDGNIRTIVSVIREANFTRSGPEVADEIEIFRGEENIIIMTQTHSKKFHCTYLLHFYPFDTQVIEGIFILFIYDSLFKVCRVDLQIEKFAKRNVELLPDKMELLSDTELTQYFMQSWILEYNDPSTLKLYFEMLKNYYSY